MTFTLDRWKKETTTRFRELGKWLKDPRTRKTPYLLYSALGGLSLWPLLEAARAGQLVPVLLALGSVAGSIGSNLLAEQIQRWVDEENVTEATITNWVGQSAATEANLREALDNILQVLEAIPQAQAGLNEKDRQWFNQILRRELSQLGNLHRFEAIIGGVIVQDSTIGGNLITGGEHVTIQAATVIMAHQVAETLWQHLNPPRPSAELLRQATEGYLTYLLDRYQHLDFKGMGVSDRVPLRLPLVDLYVPLKARIELPEGETWSRHLRLAGRQVSPEEAETVGRRLSEPAPLLDLLRQHDGLIILGDPGAGKTTFLKYLTLRLARGEGDKLGLGVRLPVLLPLSAYANALAEAEIPLDQFITAYYRNLGLELPLKEMLAEVLGQGGALLLLDGLDEVKSLAQRHLVVERMVNFFTLHRRQGNKFIFTSRIVGYREVRPITEGLAECTLVDFEGEEIEAFVEKWTGALERGVRGDTAVAAQEAAQERAELLSVVERNPGVRRLAANPLLLTILALMKRQGIALPERRVELYQKYVETLLRHWNLARGLGRPPSRDLDVVETVRILAPLALWMHETSPGVGLVKREEVRRQLEAIYASRGEAEPAPAAQRLLDDVHQSASLLLERGAGQYGFIHLTFQEYLAAVAIAQQGQQSVKPVVKALTARVGDGNWREVTLLTISYMGIVQQRDEAAGEVVRQFIKHSPQAALLAGEAVADVAGGVPPQVVEQMKRTLITMLTADRQLAPRLRANAGDILARLGDPRPGLGLRSDGLPDIVWCEVPAGVFTMGSTEYESEMPQHQVNLPAFKIGKYPITNAQYAAFVGDGGYTEKWRACWTEAGWARKGERAGPSTAGGDFDLLNRPVIDVTWYEAMAFCAWLTARLRDTGELDLAWEITLPSERQWEKAARGTNGRRYPWGDEADPNRANYVETEIRTTTAVGIFPGGASPYGCEDMSGNVWEWCRTKWQEDYKGYEDDNEPEGDARRVLRGGSFNFYRDLVRCAARGRDNPSLLLPRQRRCASCRLPHLLLCPLTLSTLHSGIK
jgi:formylglycine-generating enzyme required for sulfatase activity